MGNERRVWWRRGFHPSVPLPLISKVTIYRYIYSNSHLISPLIKLMNYGYMDDYSGRALILKDDAVPRWVDHRGHPSRRSESGRWRAAGMIIGVEIAERLAFFGISTNLVSYLTVEMGQSMAAAAKNVNLWVGTASLLPLLAASFADSFLGRYLTILLASALYILVFLPFLFLILLTHHHHQQIRSNTSFFVKIYMFSNPSYYSLFFFFSG